MLKCFVILLIDHNKVSWGHKRNSSVDDKCGNERGVKQYIKCYQNANEPPPTLIYVDRDRCSSSGDVPALKWFDPWRCHICLNIWHIMRRFNPVLTIEHHSLYGTWCQRLSLCIFFWDRDYVAKLKAATRAELATKYRKPSRDSKVSSSIKSSGLQKALPPNSTWSGGHSAAPL